MKSVSRFEANLLRLLGFFLGRVPAERAAPLIESRCEPSPCLSANAIALVQDALSKGCVAELVRRGGWRRERFVRGEGVVEGRLWQRTPPSDLGLSFSRETLAFLIWITAARPGDKEPSWEPSEAALASGDRVLLFFAYEKLRRIADPTGVARWRARQPLVQHGLCRLAFPEDYSPDAPTANCAPWISGVEACVLEALQPVLADRWLRLESGKARIERPPRMEALGASQERVLNSFLGAAEQARRWDLMRFLLQAGHRLLGPDAAPEMWVGSLHLAELPLAARAATYHAALAFVRVFERLRAWTRQARGVGRFDEGYHAAQLWKADWELYDGDVLHERAAWLRQRLDPLRQG